MEEECSLILKEIREMLKVLVDGQERLLKSMNDLREEQKRLYDEVKSNNLVLNNISLRGEVLN